MRDFKSVSRSEVYRYMGFRDEIPERNILDMTEDIINEVADAASAKFCAVDVSVKTDGTQVDFGSFSVYSKSLSKHLTDCDSAVIFAATMGTSVDMLIYKYSLVSPAKAVAAQSAATAMLEMYADDICEILAEEERENGLSVTPRFSPGYADLSLDCQADFVGVLNAAKQIGLCYTDANMLTPVKSITAVVGKSKKEHDCNPHKCSRCNNENCAYKI